jgi:hypothetical protein
MATGGLHASAVGGHVGVLDPVRGGDGPTKTGFSTGFTHYDRPPPDERRVRLRQTCGGRTALPMPRRVAHAPYVRLQSPLVWTTLSLTLRSDGTARDELVGAVLDGVVAVDVPQRRTEGRWRSGRSRST